MYLFIKRVFDILFSSIVLIIVFPIFLPVMILLRLTGEGKIFYIQQRVGKGMKPFGLIKFATMLENSSNMAGGDITTGDDPRVLKVGKFLRKTKLNEFPQFINILKGDMSVVGPRPTTFRNYSYYSESIQSLIKGLKPGLTGIGSIVFRDEESFIKDSKKDAVSFYKDDIAPYKGELELWYSKHRGILTDFLIIFTTAYVVIFPKSEIVHDLFKDLPKHNLFKK
ncbi:sugar transferase [Aequorivita capsosiphonis]|uniref:sugar transferase n=1 Tax=Aequorivita capsosiphonis TaxID=487317 RepID=UPI000417E5B4|nr:sugar transferase [Aequorivita capsosiphonis]